MMEIKDSLTYLLIDKKEHITWESVPKLHNYSRVNFNFDINFEKFS